MLHYKQRKLGRGREFKKGRAAAWNRISRDNENESIGVRLSVQLNS